MKTLIWGLLLTSFSAFSFEAQINCQLLDNSQDEVVKSLSLFSDSKDFNSIFNSVEVFTGHVGEINLGEKVYRDLEVRGVMAWTTKGPHYDIYAESNESSISITIPAPGTGEAATITDGDFIYYAVCSVE